MSIAIFVAGDGPMNSLSGFLDAVDVTERCCQIGIGGLEAVVDKAHDSASPAHLTARLRSPEASGSVERLGRLGVSVIDQGSHEAGHMGSGPVPRQKFL
jgi:hypothetical protein